MSKDYLQTDLRSVLNVKDALIRRLKSDNTDLRLERTLNRTAHNETQKQLDILRESVKLNDSEAVLAEAEIERLLAENKRIPKDAARYRWLKENHLQLGPDCWIRTGEDLDDAIDAEMAAASDSQCKSDHVSARVENRPCESCGADDWVSRDNTDQVTGTIACQKCGVEVPHDCEYSAPDGEGQEKDHD